MIPYFGSDVKLPLGLHPFGLLVAAAVLAGVALTEHRAGRMHIDRARMRSFVTWIIVGGFIGSQLLAALLCSPRELVTHPWTLVLFGRNSSSFGGFVGATVTALDDPLAVDFPEGGRYDLGLLEMIFSASLSVLVVLLWPNRRRTGTYVVLVCMAYAPVRFALDFLRATSGPGADARFFRLTLAQWGCFVLFGFAIFFNKRLREGRWSTTRASKRTLTLENT